MPIIGNRSRSGWARSFLPTTNKTTTSPSTSSPSTAVTSSPTTPKSKHPRKSRRRTLIVREFVRAHFITLSLSLSLLLFFAVIFRFGPSLPLFSSPSSTRFARSRPRKLPNPAGVQAGAGSVVDISTKELYDKIEFVDVDGGPWKQGWMVSYKGNEWDKEKLKILVVPHSHNDPGWKLTVDEYYDTKSRHILDTIVDSLSKDSRRRFIWEEMSYLERWWRDSTESKREAFRNLVNNGQLEIVGGGWVMNDEANSHYYAIIDQMTEGNMWLNETIGVIPKNAWAIDPFGYSPTMAYLLRRMGFENMLIQRTHYELKKELALHKNLEFIWRQSWDSMETTDIFVHMMPFYSYDVPHTCGPNPAICCQFDFARIHGFIYELCPWGQNPVETNAENVQERAWMLLDQYRKKSTLYRTNTLLVPLGDDFRYVSIDEAEAQFRNYQMLFDYINSNPDFHAEVKFGTLNDYFQALREEADRVNYSRPGEIGSGEIDGFPSLSGDFFTYADRQKDYWSGYYVSRPFFKAVDRVLEHTLRGSEIFMALLLGRCHRVWCEKLPISYAHKLTAARRNLALFQHHDGVTGTAKNHVVDDYGSRMHTSLQDLQIFMSKAIEVLLDIRHDKNEQTPSQFEPEQVRSKFDAQPLHKGIIIQERSMRSVVVFNPLERTRSEIVMVIVERPDVSVLDSNWTCIESQASPEMQHDKDQIFTGRHRLHWQASVPAMGLQVYYIVHGEVECEKARLAELKISSSSDQSSCPTPYSCSKVKGDVIIQNRHQTLAFDANLGSLHKVTGIEGSVNIVGEEISMYSSEGSGAYLFKPIGDARPVIHGCEHLVVTKGSLMQEVYSYPKTEWNDAPISQSTRVYNGENTVQEFMIEKEYHVELVGEHFDDREMIVRFKTDIENRRIFYSDLNGFQMSRRETYDKIPVQGNYYPMPSLALMQGEDGRRFSVHSRQSLGVASLKNGWLEIMLDRRLAKDDGRGLGQGVMDNRPMNVLFHLLLESNISSLLDPKSSPRALNPSLLSHRIGAHLNYPQHAFIAKKSQELSPQPPPPLFFSPLASSLPCDLHIVDLKIPRPAKFSSSEHPVEDPRFVLVLQRYGWDSSYCRMGRSHCTRLADEAVNLFNLFSYLEVMHIKATSLNLLHKDAEMLGYSEMSGDVVQEGHVVIPPMEIQAYRLELRPHQ